ncbi:MAG TPA: C25 family cysteine peptidase [Candidatus Thermoplasmatota archaeon]|nr:C25 family cysteine peptidase [Candidatus Thermoplasmatota archaeon]
MNKNDKLIVVGAVIVLIVAGLGVYLWTPFQAKENVGSLKDYTSITSSFSSVPTAIAVSDKNPFYALLATPLAVHYDQQGNQEVVPLYIENLSDPSSAVTRAMDEQIRIPVNLVIDDTQSAESWSVAVATKYWKHSDAALFIKPDYQGYILGVMATPLASYLSIPVFITNGTSPMVQQAMTALGVKLTVICGDNVTGYGDVLRFKSIDDIADQSMSFLQDKFGGIPYLTITNPRDAWPPQVLASVNFTVGPVTMGDESSTQIVRYVKNSLLGSNSVGTFTIPEDYKYALVKFDGINLNSEDTGDLGDGVIFNCGPMLDDVPAQLQQYEVYAGGTTMGGVPIRDSTGNIIQDRTYDEIVLYRRGGVTYKVYASPNWIATKSGQVEAMVTVDKLNNSYYPLMKDLSSIAPYLTAYHKGLIYGKPEFAFAANDNTTYLGQVCPGESLPRRNPRLLTAANTHVFWVHDQINNLLANMAGIRLDNQSDLKTLRDYYDRSPITIALVGDGTMLPQLIYNTSIEPTSVEEAEYFFGIGCPSDFIYGNIDPNLLDWSNQAPDLYSELPNQYPYQENIVGRVTGYDAQDASALIARTVFYNDIINHMGTWKNNAVVQLGGGNDFKKPLLKYILFGNILHVVKRGEPMKVDTGASYFNGLEIQKDVKALGFNTTYMREDAAGFQGFTDEAITKIKNADLLNKLLTSKRQLRDTIGVDVVQGGTYQENSNFIMANAHGCQHLFAMGDVGTNALGLGLPHGILHKLLRGLAAIIGYGPGYSLSYHMQYSPTNVDTMKLGPSYLWIESCICGKLDGMYPQQSITQVYLHAGCNCVLASTTSSNIAGGYLEPKTTAYDLPGQALIRYIQWQNNVKQGIYPDMHFGFKIYTDMLSELRKGDVSMGKALREARNVYLPEDASWKVWWSPPLIDTGIPSLNQQLQDNYMKRAAAGGNGLDPRLDNKYQSFFEYTIYGDPAFVPYIPASLS